VENTNLDRKSFLKMFGCASVCACTGIALADSAKNSNGEKVSLPMTAPPETPCDKKMEFAQTWVKRFMDLLDANLDEATRNRLMEANGKMCHQGSLHGKKVTPIPVDTFVEGLRKYVGSENARREGDAIYFNYVKNPAGLLVADGYCLCPLVEKGPAGLSGTYCQCSVGYVNDMFETQLGRPVKVELLESLKRGGKGCKFKITLV
jgi:hypothetical protein